MVMRVETVSDRARTIFVLIGRINSPEVQDLKTRMAENGNRVALDLREVRLVDLDAVRFLASAERNGVELLRVPDYVREWIQLEKRTLSDLE